MGNSQIGQISMKSFHCPLWTEITKTFLHGNYHLASKPAQGKQDAESRL
jgi:hypothetical protein